MVSGGKTPLTGEGETMPEPFTIEDWVEIYYAVRDKYEDGRAVSTDRKWKAHLKKILEKIGPDGENMSKGGNVDFTPEPWTVLKKKSSSMYFFVDICKPMV